MVKCAFCSDPAWMVGTCSACLGAGRVEIKRDPLDPDFWKLSLIERLKLDYPKCPNCDGLGKIYTCILHKHKTKDPRVLSLNSLPGATSSHSYQGNSKNRDTRAKQIYDANYLRRLRL